MQLQISSNWNVSADRRIAPRGAGAGVSARIGGGRGALVSTGVPGPSLPLTAPMAAGCLRRARAARSSPSCPFASPARWTRSSASTSGAIPRSPSCSRRRRAATTSSTTRRRASRCTGTACSRAAPRSPCSTRSDHYKLSNPRTEDLSEWDVVLLRQDPPFDMAYVTTTHLLERIHEDARRQRPRTCATRPRRCSSSISSTSCRRHWSRAHSRTCWSSAPATRTSS